MKTCVLLVLCFCAASVGAQPAAFMPFPMETTSSVTVHTMPFTCQSAGYVVRTATGGGQRAPSPSLRRVEILTGAAVPSYVPAVSGDLNPFDAQGTVVRRNGPPTTGGTDPVNPDIKQPTPMGDALLFLLALLGVYGLFHYARRVGQLCQTTNLNTNL